MRPWVLRVVIEVKLQLPPAPLTFKIVKLLFEDPIADLKDSQISSGYGQRLN